MKAYFDNAATTRVRKEVVEAMNPFFDSVYGNASSLHSMGVNARNAIDASREKAAKALGVSDEEIFFTSCATEADNMALKGTAFAAKRKGKNHLIVSAIEHHAILHSADWLESMGFSVTRLPVDEFGLVSPEKLSEAITDKTFLVSVMYANNEIGTVEPIKELSKISAEKDVLFHSDAVQAFSRVPFELENVSMLSLSAHKFYGPKGVGLLLKKAGVDIEPLVHGGGHELGLRSGTENVPGIVGMGTAMELAVNEMDFEVKKQIKMRDALMDGILSVDSTRINGHREKRLPNNVNASFSFIEGESLVLRLDEKGIMASTGSACSSPDLEPSHVLTSIGLAPGDAHGSLRLSLGRFNSMNEVKFVLDVLPGVVEELRKISPFGGN